MSKRGRSCLILLTPRCDAISSKSARERVGDPMLRQWIRLTPIQCFLLTIIGVAAIGTIYYFRTYGHYRLSPEIGWYGPPVVQAGKTIAILEGKISSDAGRERLIQLIRDFAKKKRFNI